MMISVKEAEENNMAEVVAEWFSGILKYVRLQDTRHEREMIAEVYFRLCTFKDIFKACCTHTKA